MLLNFFHIAKETEFHRQSICEKSYGTLGILDKSFKCPIALCFSFRLKRYIINPTSLSLRILILSEGIKLWSGKDDFG